MRNKLGIACMVLGAALMLGALLLMLHNRQEAADAKQSSADLMPQIIQEIDNSRKQDTLSHRQDETVSGPVLPEPEQESMTEVVIDGCGYIGYLSVPALGLDLPILAHWNYVRLKIAPCRYTGTVKGNDFVLMAHNYPEHFGRIGDLKQGDLLYFTDMEGTLTEYEVVAMDVLLPTAVEEVTAGDFDLTLFTCTYGGQSRVTVYCDKVR